MYLICKRGTADDKPVMFSGFIQLQYGRAEHEPRFSEPNEGQAYIYHVLTDCRQAAKDLLKRGIRVEIVQLKQGWTEDPEVE